MSWYNGNQQTIKFEDYNSIVKELKGSIKEDEAKILLTKLLKNNIGFTFRLLTKQELLPLQEIFIKSILLKDNSLVLTSRGLGKCESAGSYILTEKGFKKIDDIIIGEKVQSISGLNTVLAKTENPEEDGFEIVTNKGISVKGKIGHKILLFNPEKVEFYYDNIENLTGKEIIPIRKGPNVWGNLEIDAKRYIPQSKGRGKAFEFSNNNDFYYYLGLLLGDGCTRGNKSAIDITSEDQETIKFLKDFYKQICSASNVGVRPKQETSAFTVVLNNIIFKQFLSNLDFNIKAYSYQKNIPDLLLGLKKEYLCNLLSGLFDTDGSVHFSENKKKNSQTITLEYASSSLELIKNVQRILLNIGIIAHFNKKHKGGKFEICGVKCNTQVSYRLSITNYENIKLFSENIGFKLPRKQSLVDRYLKEKYKPIDYNSNLIPIGNYLKKKYTGWYFKTRGFKVHKGLSPNRLKYLIENNLLDKEDSQKLQYILDGNFSFNTVKSITPVRCRTYDIQVENEECYWSDGIISHNSYIISVLSILYPLFNPDSKTVLISANFRGSRRILEEAEKIVNGPGADLINECFPVGVSRRPDQFIWKLPNGSTVTALPLSGDSVRGTRANFLAVDEGLLISKEIQEVILRPFLTAKIDIQGEMKIRKIEDDLIRKGLLKEKERISFPKNKYAIFSSASYQFEYLYETYKMYLDQINKKDRKPDDPTYLVIRASYKCLPENSILDMGQINAAKEQYGEEADSFKREYRAIFIDSHANYFDVKKLHECTVENGNFPTVQLKGEHKLKYILAIDPSYSKSKISDFFAMGIYMLDEENKRIYQVHTYGRAGGDIKDHYEYFTYLYNYFKPELVVIDDSGTEFIHGYNESVIAAENNIKLDFIDADMNSDDYITELNSFRRQYNKQGGKIVYGQKFQSLPIRQMNEHLQNCIAAKRVWFASSIESNDSSYKKAVNIFNDIAYKFKDKYDKELGVSDFISEQDNWMRETKSQLALIEVKSTGLGTLQYDLPQKLRRSSSDNPNRPRKDNYSCLLIANWAAKVYFDMLFQPAKETNINFTPTIIFNGYT